MLNKKRANYFLLTIASAIFLLTSFTSIGYYVDAYKNKKAMERVGALYNNSASTDHLLSNTIAEKENTGVLSIETSEILVTESLDREPLLHIQERFKSLFEINDDIVGWIRIEQTVINYPVVQANDNEYYLTKDFYKEENVNGSIMMDYRNQIENQEKHWILYGHNMKNKSMFMSLLNYESKWYFNQHPIIEFDTLYSNYKWQIFSVYYSNKEDNYIKTNFQTDEDYKNFLIKVSNKSLHATDIQVDETDSILTLSTCAYIEDGGRFVVHAKLIK